MKKAAAWDTAYCPSEDAQHLKTDGPCAASYGAGINYHKGILVMLTCASHNSPENECRQMFCGKPIGKSVREQVSSKSHNTTTTLTKEICIML